VANTEAGFDVLERLLTEHQVRRVGIEGSGNWGRGVASRLALGGAIEVVEVPPSLTSRERSARPGQGKTDPVDAALIARITAREATLPSVRLAVGDAADLRALAGYRRQLTDERTALANRTHAELHGLNPGYHAKIPRLTAATFITAALEMLDRDRRRGRVPADIIDLDLWGRSGRGRDDPRRGRRRAPLPIPARLRRSQRQRPHPGILRTDQPAPAQPIR